MTPPPAPAGLVSQGTGPTLFHPLPNAMPVFDPVLKRFGAVWVDLRHIAKTRAVERPWRRFHPERCLANMLVTGSPYPSPAFCFAHVVLWSSSCAKYLL